MEVDFSGAFLGVCLDDCIFFSNPIVESFPEPVMVFFFQSDCRILPESVVFFFDSYNRYFGRDLYFFFYHDSESDRFFIGDFVQRVYDLVG